MFFSPLSSSPQTHSSHKKDHADTPMPQRVPSQQLGELKCNLFGSSPAGLLNNNMNASQISASDVSILSQSAISSGTPFRSASTSTTPALATPCDECDGWKAEKQYLLKRQDKLVVDITNLQLDVQEVISPPDTLSLSVTIC
jgi:hypothetical protein